MTNIEIITRDDTLVVDSRLIAKDLGIAHHTFLKTLNKYLDKIESCFGVVRFEIHKPPEGSNGGRPEKYALLTEPQATLLMTFSRNTEQVINCKVKLVTAFEKAKKVIKTVIPEQNNRLKELELELLLAKEQNKLSESQTKLLATVQLLETVSPGLAPLALGRADAVVERVEYVERVIDKSQDKVTEGIGITYLTQRFGFKNNHQTWQFLESIGYGKDSGKWELQLTAIETPKLPKEALKELSFHFKNASRQLMLGE